MRVAGPAAARRRAEVGQRPDRPVRAALDAQVRGAQQPREDPAAPAELGGEVAEGADAEAPLADAEVPPPPPEAATEQAAPPLSSGAADALPSSAPPLMFILGPPGSGKSTEGGAEAHRPEGEIYRNTWGNR